MSDKQLVRGTVILTASIFLSKALGLIYTFPFKAIVGLEGLALYQYGYSPYTILLSLATMGVPLAVSKFVSKYNALGDYRTGQRLFKSGIVVMAITGLIAFLLLFLLAKPIAHQVVSDQDLGGNTIEDVVFTIRMVSFALLIVPIMALIRGYFQGHQSMGPTAISQVVEQIVRVLFILVFTYLIINVWNGSLSTAVGFATFGAFIGALGGLAVLLVYWWKRRGYLRKTVQSSTVDHNIPLRKMYKELISYALPLSFVGLAIPLFQVVDLMTFNKAMMSIGHEQAVAEMYYGAFAQASHKLILIPVSVATAMSLTILPTVTKAYVSNDVKTLRRQITQTFQIILFLSIPASLGLMLLSDSAYATLYGVDDMEIGAVILKYYAPSAILFSIFAVSASLLQGINQQKFTVFALAMGIIFKAIFNYWFIVLFDFRGAIIATMVGYFIAISINLWAIWKSANYRYTFLLKRLLLISIFASMMGIGVIIVRNMLEYVLPLESRLQYFLVLVVGIIVGVVIYFYLSVRSGLARQIFGKRLKFLNKKKARSY